MMVIMARVVCCLVADTISNVSFLDHASDRLTGQMRALPQTRHDNLNLYFGVLVRL